MRGASAPCSLSNARGPCPARVRGAGVGRRCRVAYAATKQERLTGRSYTEVVQQLAERALAAADAATSSSSSSSDSSSAPRQHIVGIAGAPGSGKTTLAQLVADRINTLAEQRGSGPAAAVVVPMDGFHYFRWQLDQMPHPEEAYARRGAHWTFDGAAFVDCVRAIRATQQASVPSFDHGVGDPVEGDIRVTPSSRVVLVEGNYLFLDEDPWLGLAPLFDDTWFVDVPLDTAMERVFRRQVALGADAATAAARVSGNDRPNGLLVDGTKGRANVLVPSDIPFQ